MPRNLKCKKSTGSPPSCHNTRRRTDPPRGSVSPNMDAIFNHNINRRAPLQQHEHNTGRASVPSADVEGKDPFCDFPLRQRRHYGEHPATRGELSQGLNAPQVDLGGGDIAGHHRAPLQGRVPASGVPNYPGRGADDFESHPNRQHQHQHQHPANKGTSSGSGWQTTAQAQMAGESDNHKKASGKKMMPSPGEGRGYGGGGVAGGAGSLLGYQGPHGGNAGGVTFGAKAAPLQDRVDPLHNQVDQRGGLALETLPFVPGYGGHVPVSHENLNVAVQKGLRPRQTKDLIVENYSNKMVGCTKITQVGRR